MGRSPSQKQDERYQTTQHCTLNIDLSYLSRHSVVSVENARVVVVVDILSLAGCQCGDHQQGVDPGGPVSGAPGES